MSPKKKRAAANSPADSQDAVVRVHIWLQSSDGVAFGLGRLMLLEAIEESGSLKSAAERLGMSYRAAWGKLKSSEEALGQPLVEKTGGNRSGYTLTPYGRQLTDCFRQWFHDVEATALTRARELFPFDVSGFGKQSD